MKGYKFLRADFSDRDTLNLSPFDLFNGRDGFQPDYGALLIDLFVADRSLGAQYPAPQRVGSPLTLKLSFVY